MKKIIFLFTFLSLLISSCGSQEVANVHEHTYSSSWSYDDVFHWHQATCGHDIGKDYMEHKMVDTIVEPTKTEQGYTIHTCSICDYSYKDNFVEPNYEYTITWKNWDGEVLEIDNNVPKGTMPCYDGPIPEKNADGEFAYGFCGWNIDVTPASGDITYRAEYNSCYRIYTIDSLPKWAVFEGHKIYIWAWRDSFNCDGIYDEIKGYENWYEATYLGNNKISFSVAKYIDGFQLVLFDAKESDINFSNKLNQTQKYNVSLHYSSYAADVSLWESSEVTINHSYSSKWSYDENYHWHQCTDKGYEDLYDEKKSHSFVDTVTKEATYNAEGTLTHSCECGYSYNTKIAKLEHHYASTLSYDSSGHWYACIDSGYENLKKDYTKHTLKTAYSVKPTCTEKGSEYEYCSVCGYKTSPHDVECLGHNLEFADIDDVFHREKCSRCDFEKETVLPHNYVEYSYNEISGLSRYEKAYICEDCGHKFVQDSRIFTFRYQDGCARIYLISAIASKTIILPSEVNGFSVNDIEDTSVFYENKHLEQIFFMMPSLKKFPYLRFLNNLKSINLPSQSTLINNRAFYDLSSLEYVSIPDSVTYIGEFAFSGCSSLKSINIPNGLTSIEPGVFSSCSSLDSVSIPDGVTTIENSAFYNCSSLISVDLGDGITSIGSSAFYNCSSLKSISIPDGVTTIENSSFYNCSSLISVDLGDGITSIGSSAFYNCSSLKSISIPDGVAAIEDYTFYNCSSLENIDLGDGVDSIASRHAFYGCQSIKTMNIESDNPCFVFLDGALYNQYNGSLYGLFCCPSCSGTFSIPNSVYIIDEFAFYGCSPLLESIIIPTSVDFINVGAFEGLPLTLLIYYEGTMEEWNQINNQSYNSGYVIHCSDGDITLT